MGGDPDTLVTEVAEEEASRPRQPVLFQVLQCDDLARPAARYALGQLQAVEIGRGDRVEQSGDRLIVGLSDGRVSHEHAALRHVNGVWILRDLGSRNGTYVNGTTVTEHRLGDGDVIEVGHTFFLWRTQVECRGSLVAVSVQDVLPGLATVDSGLEQTLRSLDKIAASSVPVLIAGESGTGKELVARAIHALSHRKELVAVDCGALPASVAAAELFGSRKGAYSGAEDRVGLIPAADRGTLFLDEVGNMPAEVQAMLLRVLETGRVRPLGGVDESRVDLRVVAATNDDLDSLVGGGAFREDLRRRIAGYVLRLPPLRERAADLGLIMAGLPGLQAQHVMMDIGAARAILRYSWPGNIRELLRAIEVALTLSSDGTVRGVDLPAEVTSFRERTDRARGETPDELRTLLEAHGGNVAAVARALATSRAQVHRMAKRFKIDLGAFRA